MISLTLLALAGEVAAKPSIAVLGLEPVDEGNANSQEKTASLARSLTDQLRARVPSSGYTLAPNSQKELLDVKLMSDCFDETADCMAAAGKEMSAQTLLYGKLSKTGKSYTVSVTLLTVADKSVKTASKNIAAGDADEAGLKKVASAVFSELAGEKPEKVDKKATLVLQANVEKGTVYVDNVASGTLVAGQATIPNLKAGSAMIRVESEGYKDWEERVDLKSGENKVSSDLVPEKGIEIAPKPKKAGRPGGAYRALFWTTVVTTGVGVAAFTVTGLKVSQLEQDQDDYIAMNAGLFNASDAGRDSCVVASEDPVTHARLKSICDDGKSMATITNVLIGATAVSALAAGFFLYKGYIAAGKSPKTEHSSRRHKRTIVVAPTITPAGAGIGAVIQF